MKMVDFQSSPQMWMKTSNTMIFWNMVWMPNYRGHFSSSVLLHFQPTWRIFKSSQICRLPAPLRHPGMQWDSDVRSLMISFRAGSLPMGIRQIRPFISLLSSSPKNSTNIVIEGVGEPQRTAVASLFLADLQRKLKVKGHLYWNSL